MNYMVTIPNGYELDILTIAVTPEKYTAYVNDKEFQAYRRSIELEDILTIFLDEYCESLYSC